MEVVDVNGGNAEAANENSNLENVANTLNILQDSEESIIDDFKMEPPDTTDDIKLSPPKTSSPASSPAAKRKLRKFKANSTSSNETDLSPKLLKGRKRKFSELDDLSSEESIEFTGFDHHESDEVQTFRNHVLQKLIAEAEFAEALVIQRNSINIKSEKEFEESTSPTVNFESDTDMRLEDSLPPPTNNSPSAVMQKFKGSLKSRSNSPSTPGRLKSLGDMSNPAYKEPFKFGWKRELVYRATFDVNMKKNADIYYYTPQGKKVRSFREVAEFLNNKELTLDNFTFFKEPIGMNDSLKETIRQAKKPKGVGVITPPSIKKKAVPSKAKKKASPPKKKAKLATHTPKGTPKSEPVPMRTPITTPVSTLSPHTNKTPAKSPKTPKIASRNRTTPKRMPQIKMKSSEPADSTSPPESNAIQSPSAMDQCNVYTGQQKSEELAMPKIQDPCSIRCSMSMGLIPSLQCRVCLCLYHPECVGCTGTINYDDYTCKNCQPKSSTNPPSTPPPLIPISSMIGSQKTKSKYPTSSPPKLQRIPKSDGTDASNENVSSNSIEIQTPLNANDKVEIDWFRRAKKDLLPSYDGTIPKPPQNIALLGGKRFIVIPKNNALAVQPAITTKLDKFGDKPPILQDNILTMTNAIDDSSKRTLDKSKDSSNSIKQSTTVQANRLTANDASNGRFDVRRKRDTEFDYQHFMGSVCAGYHALLRTFQYLNVKELLRAARVCKMWRDLAAHPSLWTTGRMKNSRITDWTGLVNALQRSGTRHLDLRKAFVAGECASDWNKFLMVIPKVTSLVRLDLCPCPDVVVEEVIKSCPQLEVFGAMSIKCDFMNLDFVQHFQGTELRLNSINGMAIQDLTPLQNFTGLTRLSLTSVKDLGKKNIEIIPTLVNLESLGLGECSDFPDEFGTTILIKLKKLKCLRLEKGQKSCCTFNILEGVSKMESLCQMELINFDIKNGFDQYLANCKNIKRLLIIPTYISQSATSNNLVLEGVTKLSNSLTHFVWGLTLELLRVTELFVNQCNLINRTVTDPCIPVLKPIPCLKLIKEVDDENDNQKGDDKSQMTSPQVDILLFPQLQKLLSIALPKTRVKILKIPFFATWRQNISDTST